MHHVQHACTMHLLVGRERWAAPLALERRPAHAEASMHPRTFCFCVRDVVLISFTTTSFPSASRRALRVIGDCSGEDLCQAIRQSPAC